ncbi:hypothetical protein ES703_39338 [subsurface metagenome]
MVMTPLETESRPQQPGSIVRVCWDDLFEFLRGWFAKTAAKPQKPVLKIARFSDDTTTTTKVVSWEVTDEWDGYLKEISIISDTYATLVVGIVIAGVAQAGLSLQSALTIPFDNLKLSPKEVVEIWINSDGVVVITVDCMITGKEKPRG